MATASISRTDRALENIERLIRRLPRVVREVRGRFDQVQSDRSLSELIRALLPIYFDEVYPMARTPSYSATTRTDYRIGRERLAIVGHRMTRAMGEEDFLERLSEDARDFMGEDVDVLVVFAYDPEDRLVNPERVEAVGSRGEGGLQVVCWVAG